MGTVILIHSSIDAYQFIDLGDRECVLLKKKKAFALRQCKIAILILYKTTNVSLFNVLYQNNPEQNLDDKQRVSFGLIALEQRFIKNVY